MTEFDYVIVGAGSAGCLLANRLSRDPRNQVALVEAGGSDDRWDVRTPLAYVSLHRSAVDYGYSAEPQAELYGRSVYQPRGKVLGGCSSTNCMAYVRGCAADFDDWAAAGNPGWAYADMLPRFIRHERNLVVDDPALHGVDGELTVSRADAVSPTARAFLRGCVDLGIAETPDYNCGSLDGASALQFTIADGRRASAYRAFVDPVVRHRRNLHVLSELQATRILVDGQRRAQSVEVRGATGTYRLRAGREIVLSAGSFGSPQLLMLSGIGDAGALASLGIPVTHHAPAVGLNLHDHPFVPLAYRTRGTASLNRALYPGNVLRYLLRRTGPLSRAPLEAVAFARTRAGLDRPDIELHFANAYGADLYDYRTLPIGRDGFTLFPTLLTPASRGRVTLRSADPAAAPVIEQQYLTDAGGDDLRSLVAGVRLVDDLVEKTGLGDLVTGRANDHAHDGSQAGIEHLVRQRLESCYHPVGTCAMGPEPSGVVDAELRVRGVRHLRVVDASVMPKIVAGNTNAAVYAIAEKAAEDILRAPADTTASPPRER